MRSVICPLIVILVLGPLGASPSPHLAARQGLECGAAPVDCGDGWCCTFGFVCQATPSNGFVCIDTILTQSDGSPYTLAAWNPTSYVAEISSVTQPLSLTFSNTTQVISFTAISTTSSTSSSSLNAITAITTGSLSARPSTIIPTTSSSSFGETSVSLTKGWWIGVVLGVAWMLQDLF
ncbi:hypothetical protein BKA65DRAFT_494314 [Rhexocercosporidium sp. MPI-PUGE-AT-0058]|nr:hypothetical protein BKA65DRAFT_494314 [Rhexocercosporidium sp. MPI-PUGE-AT-0058]